VVRDRNISAAIWGNDRWVDSSGSRRSSAPVSADAPGRLHAFPGQLGPERLGLPDEGPEAGPALKQVIDLTHERPGTGQVGEREVDASQLDPGLDGEVGKRVGQQRSQVLGTEQFPARRRDISPAYGCTGSQRADEGVAKLSSIPARRKTVRAWPARTSARSH